MAKQKEYLAALLNENKDKDEANQPSGQDETLPANQQTLGSQAQQENRASDAENKVEAPAKGSRAARRAGLSLLGGRENALARIASGEVKQVTQLKLDPAKVRIWPGNARIHERLTADNCRELINAIIAENGQKMPAIIRRIDDDAQYEYEVIAGTRRHFSISWLRQNHYPDMMFLAQVVDLDDEAAFRLADIENRARKDVSDLERARNYAHALELHYKGHVTQMAERLNISKGWLSKMVKMAEIPDQIANCFTSWHDLGVNPGYKLARYLSGEGGPSHSLTARAASIAAEQRVLAREGKEPLSAKQVLTRLYKNYDAKKDDGFEPMAFIGPMDRPALSVTSASRSGLGLKIHAGHGASDAELVRLFKSALKAMREKGIDAS